MACRRSRSWQEVYRRAVRSCHGHLVKRARFFPSSFPPEHPGSSHNITNCTLHGWPRSPGWRAEYPKQLDYSGCCIDFSYGRIQQLHSRHIAASAGFLLSWLASFLGAPPDAYVWHGAKASHTHMPPQLGDLGARMRCGYDLVEKLSMMPDYTLCHAPHLMTRQYTLPGSSWRPSACEADVIATRPRVPCSMSRNQSNLIDR